MDKNIDNDPLETQEWRQALDSVLEFEGPDRAHFLLDELFTEARLARVQMRRVRDRSNGSPVLRRSSGKCSARELRE